MWRSVRRRLRQTIGRAQGPAESKVPGERCRPRRDAETSWGQGGDYFGGIGELWIAGIVEARRDLASRAAESTGEVDLRNRRIPDRTIRV